MGAVSPNFGVLELVGSAAPRLWTRPLRNLTPRTSLGFEVIDFSRDVLGVPLLPWQEWLFIHGLELKPDGSYRFRTVLVLVARQNGKTTALMVLALWRMVMDAARMILGTSTNLDYARESWQKATELAWGPKGSKVFQGVPELEGEFLMPRYANGEQELTHVGGGRYKIGTASRTGGRSLSVDLLILDELREHRTWEAWSAASKTTNARPRGQRWALSNMGDDGSVVLNHLQAKAAEGSDPQLGIFEWSAPPGCDVEDWSVWPMANPALGHRISMDTLASDLSTDAEEVFRTEVLCQRVPLLEPLPITLPAWVAAEKRFTKRPDGVPTFGLSVSPMLSSAAITAVVQVGEAFHIELVDWRDGVDWLPSRAAELKGRYAGCQFVAMSTGAVASLVPDLKRVEVEPEMFGATELGKAYGSLHRQLVDGRLTQDGARGFELALEGAVKKDVGEGLWSLSWRKSSADLAPIESAAIAVWHLAGRPAYDLMTSVW
jgi:hypothetical protein